jgi:hypothetical protein
MARSFLPTIPAAALILVLRAVEPGGRTLALAVVELCAYVVVMALLTWRLESGLLREAIAMVRSVYASPAAASHTARVRA